MRDGQSCQVGYATKFLINWPEHLGGGHVDIDFVGTMVLVPLLAT